MRVNGFPGPFEWIDIPAGQVTLAAGGYLSTETTFDVGAFSIAKHPVTNRQYAVFMESGAYLDRAWWTDHGWTVKERQGWTQPRLWENGAFRGDNCPVIGVSWHEAAAYCRWLSAVTGQPITLPTEQQWQRAAQGDDARAFPWGDEAPHEELCNWGRNVDKTTPVSRYPDGASPFGVLDMSGNVWELCLTGFESGTTDLDNAERRVVRGGCWVNDSPVSLLATLRDGPYPIDAYQLCGFRCARPV